MVVSPRLGEAGEIHGRVIVPQSPAQPPPPLSPYARIRYSGKPPTADEHQSMDEIIGVVYLDAHPNLTQGDLTRDEALMDQQNLTIIPHILPIRVGTRVRFLNNDQVHHNLFSFSPPQKFDLGRYGRGESRSVTFNRVGTVHVFCDIHSNMHAVILVLPNGYYATVRRDGKYLLKGVPPGRYRMVAWTESFGELSVEAAVTQDEPLLQDFHFAR